MDPLARDVRHVHPVVASAVELIYRGDWIPHKCREGE